MCLFFTMDRRVRTDNFHSKKLKFMSFASFEISSVIFPLNVYVAS